MTFNSYSSFGEDAILNGIIKRLEWLNDCKLENLTYVDLGCYEPIDHSNTFFLYDKGWTGTLVDANPALIDKITTLRPKDIFLNVLVSTDNNEKDFFIFSDEGASNTASKEFAEKISLSQGVEVSKTVKVKSMTIDEIVKKHIDNFKQDPFFIDIDIEGHDLEILESYSWKVRIPIIMIEENVGEQYFNSKIKTILLDNGYIPIASTILSTIYIDETSDIFKSIKKIGNKNYE